MIKALPLLVLLSGCSFIPGTNANKESKAMDAVRHDLVDGDSAKFREFQHWPGYVCGSVNAKNSIGGYVGFQPFMVKDTGEVWMRDPSDQSVMALMTNLKKIEECEKGPQA